MVADRSSRTTGCVACAGAACPVPGEAVGENTPARHADIAPAAATTTRPRATQRRRPRDPRAPAAAKTSACCAASRPGETVSLICPSPSVLFPAVNGLWRQPGAPGADHRKLADPPDPVDDGLSHTVVRTRAAAAMTTAAATLLANRNTAERAGHQVRAFAADGHDLRRTPVIPVVSGYLGE